MSLKSSTNHLFITFAKYQANEFFLLVQPILPHRRDADTDRFSLASSLVRVRGCDEVVGGRIVRGIGVPLCLAYSEM